MDILRTRKNPKSSKDGIKKSTSKLRQNFFEHIFATANSGRPAKICSKAISAAQIFNNFKRDITREKGDTFSPSFTIAQKSKMAVFPKKTHVVHGHTENPEKLEIFKRWHKKIHLRAPSKLF